MSLIPQTFIDSLLDRVDIVDLIDSRVKLKKSGKDYSACCPFHDEKTPSFTVSQDKQFYYCFGCGASGNAIGFIMAYDNRNFPEAIEQVAGIVGMEVPREEISAEQKAADEDRSKLYDLLEQASDYYQQMLRQHPQKRKAVDYLQRRGLSGAIAKQFAIGYAPPGWDNLLQAMGSSAEAQRLLIESGMLVEKESSHQLYDRFRERVIFPIHDVRGRVIGFGGRVLNQDKPKYLNSPESPVFHKGEELYGLYEARQATNKLEQLLVVEGYMDVVALAQYDIRNAVATLGTACREDHLRKAFKYCPKIVFCFDGDAAGRRAAKKALENSLPVLEDGRQVRFLFLPEGEDPDTLVRQLGAEKFLRLVDNAVPMEDFFFQTLSEEHDNSLGGKAKLSKQAAPLLNLLPGGVFRELMFAQLAKRTGLDLPTLMELVDEPIQPLAEPEPVAPIENRDPQPEEPPPEYDGPPPLEEYEQGAYSHHMTAQPRPNRRGDIFKLSPARLLPLMLLHYPELAKAAEEVEALEDQPNYQIFVELLAFVRQRPQFSTGQIIGYIQGSGKSEWSKLLEDSSNLLSQAKTNANFDAQSEFNDCLKRVLRQVQQERLKTELTQLSRKPLGSMSEEEKARYREVLSLYAEFSKSGAH